MPSAPVEAVIALSIVFVAVEIVHAQKGREGITVRQPWIVAFTFGLLHGFGFAGALSEVGLPQGHIPLALLFFNVGVELGQLLSSSATVLDRFECARAVQSERGFAIRRAGWSWCHPMLSAAWRCSGSSSASPLFKENDQHTERRRVIT